MANSGGKKQGVNRETDSQLEARVSQLERDLASLREHAAQLDERLQKMANLIATTQAGRL